MEEPREERTPLDASQVAIKPAARHGEPTQVFPANAAAPDGRPRLDGVIGWCGIHAVAPQTGDRASPDSLRWNLDLVLDQRGTDMTDLPGGASGAVGARLQGWVRAPPGAGVDSSRGRDDAQWVFSLRESGCACWLRRPGGRQETGRPPFSGGVPGLPCLSPTQFQPMSFKSMNVKSNGGVTSCVRSPLMAGSIS
jgi:hypothetical protein